MPETALNPVIAKSLDQYACDEQATEYAKPNEPMGASYALRGLEWLDDLAPSKVLALVKAINTALQDERETAFRAGWEAARDAQRLA